MYMVPIVIIVGHACVSAYEAFHHSLPKNLQNSTFQAFYGPPSNAIYEKIIQITKNGLGGS